MCLEFSQAAPQHGSCIHHRDIFGRCLGNTSHSVLLVSWKGGCFCQCLGDHAMLGWNPDLLHAKQVFIPCHPRPSEQNLPDPACQLWWQHHLTVTELPCRDIRGLEKHDLICSWKPASAVDNIPVSTSQMRTLGLTEPRRYFPRVEQAINDQAKLLTEVKWEKARARMPDLASDIFNCCSGQLEWSKNDQTMFREHVQGTMFRQTFVIHFCEGFAPE